jgi:hypothetical protein
MRSGDQIGERLIWRRKSVHNSCYNGICSDLRFVHLIKTKKERIKFVGEEGYSSLGTRDRMLWERSLRGWRAQMTRYDFDLGSLLKLIKICSTEETTRGVTVTK